MCCYIDKVWRCIYSTGVGSWDESDADEKTLREIRTNYQQEKQREEQKIKEGISQNVFDYK